MLIHRLQWHNNHYWSLQHHDQQTRNNNLYLLVILVISNKLFKLNLFDNKNLHCKFKKEIYKFDKNLIFFFSSRNLNEPTGFNGQQEIVQENQQQTKQTTTTTTTEGSKLIKLIKRRKKCNLIFLSIICGYC
jgi:hypothetical protein